MLGWLLFFNTITVYQVHGNELIDWLIDWLIDI